LQFAQKNRRHPVDLFEAKIKVIHKKKIGGLFNLATENLPKLSIL